MILKIGVLLSYVINGDLYHTACAGFTYLCVYIKALYFIHRPLKSKHDLKPKRRDDTGPRDAMQLLDIENDFLHFAYK